MNMQSSYCGNNILRIANNLDHFLPRLGFGGSTKVTLLLVLLASVSLMGGALRRFPERVVGTNVGSISAVETLTVFAAFGRGLFTVIGAGGLLTILGTFVGLTIVRLVEAGII
jgi:hypothetical protein